MTTITKTVTLDEKTKSCLASLINANRDSHEIMGHAAVDVADPELSTTFGAIAERRRGYAENLQAFLDASTATRRTEEDGTLLGALHRIWTDLRSAISGGDPIAILSEAERAEDRMKATYEKALRVVSNTPVHDAVAHQFLEVKTDHDRVRDLRDARKAARRK